MISRGKLLLIGILALFLAMSPGSAFALSADELLKLLEEEQVVTPQKAETIKQKAKKVEKEKPSWKAYWKEGGLTVERTDGQFKVRVGGRLQLDFASISCPHVELPRPSSPDHSGIGNPAAIII